MKLCPEREVCSMWARTDNLPPNHDVRTKMPCMYWVKGECIKLGESCNLEKMTRIRAEHGHK